MQHKNKEFELTLIDVSDTNMHSKFFFLRMYKNEEHKHNGFLYEREWMSEAGYA